MASVMDVVVARWRCCERLRGIAGGRVRALGGVLMTARG